MIEFDGVRSTALGCFVERYPKRPIPKRKSQRYDVPGRNGAVIVTEDAWETVTQEYEIYLSAETPGLPSVAAQVTRWLAVSGFRLLEDEYDRDTYRLAQFLGPLDLENTLNCWGRAKIRFECLPQRWLKSGALPVQATNGMRLINPTGNTARPLLKLSGSGAATLTVGAVTLSVTVTDGMLLDCEREWAWKEAGGAVLNLNTAVVGDFPTLGRGESVISWAGGITGVTITPRWYDL